jgi:Domain of unknown function (DUF4126)
MDAVSYAHVLAFGFCLSVLAGMRAILPLLIVCLGIRYGWFSAGESFQWIGSEVSLWTLSIAFVAECVIDAIPVVDNFVDWYIAPFVKPIGALLAAGSIVPSDPTIALVIGATIGTPAALAWHFPKAKLRLASTGTTLGAGNPFLSAAESVATLVGASLSVVAPYVAAVLFIVMIAVLWITAIVIVKLARAVAKKAVEHAPAARAAATAAVKTAKISTDRFYAFAKSRVTRASLHADHTVEETKQS